MSASWHLQSSNICNETPKYVQNASNSKPKKKYHYFPIRNWRSNPTRLEAINYNTNKWTITNDLNYKKCLSISDFRNVTMQLFILTRERALFSFYSLVIDDIVWNWMSYLIFDSWLIRLLIKYAYTV